MPTHSDDCGAAEIAERFPGWNVYATRHPDGTSATLMATRRRPLTKAEQAAGLARTRIVLIRHRLGEAGATEGTTR